MNKLNSLDIWQHQWQLFSKGSSYHLNDNVISQILNIFKQKIKGVKILELGAGSGGDILCLSKLGADTTALDFSQKSISIINNRAKNQKLKIKTICQDCQQTGLPSNYFDLVFSVGLVEHFIKPLQTIKEQIRILKPGGFLIIDVPQKFNLYTLVKKIRMATKTYPFGWETEYSVFNLKKFGQKLKLKTIGYYGRDSAFTLKIPSSMKNTYKKLFSHIENSPIAPYVCLNLGFIYQKPQNYENK